MSGAAALFYQQLFKIKARLVCLVSLLAGEPTVEVSRKKMRQEVLEKIKYLKTCAMARELCLLVRTNRAVLEPKDVQDVCRYISTLCKEEGCSEPSELCRKAAESVGSKDEENYLELCAQSCVKCGEAKRPSPKREPYVA